MPASLSPRILTLDPLGVLARRMRALLDLADRPAVHLDAPNIEAALFEVEAGAIALLFAVYPLPDVDVLDFAVAVRERQPNAAIVLLADPDEEVPGTVEDWQAARFVLLRTPVDPQLLLRMTQAAVRGEDVRLALEAAPEIALRDAGAARLAPNMPVPAIDPKAVRSVLDRLAVDVGVPSVMLLSRTGSAIAEVGASGLSPAQLAGALAPSIESVLAMGSLAGARTALMQVYNGETHDIFALSVGVHYLLVCVYDGQNGMRQLGAISRLGRRAAEDLITLLGANAYALEAPDSYSPADSEDASSMAEEPARRKKTRAAPPTEPELDPVEPLAVAETWGPPEVPHEPVTLRLEPLLNLDVNIFDDSALERVDSSSFDDLFNPDMMAQIANENRSGRGPLTYDEARDLGIL